MRNKLLALMIWPIVALLFTSCSAVNKDKDALSFRIQSDKKVYQPDENIIITSELINNTGHRIKVFTNLVSGTDSFYLWTSLHFRRSDGGMVTSFWCLYMDSSSVVWKTVGPKETLKTAVPIGHFMFSRAEPSIDTLPPGDYNIFAEYEFDKTKAEAMGVTIDKTNEDVYWFGKIISNTIPITIK